MFIVSSKYEVTVSFEDLDLMEVVWHGNYFHYLERARCDLFTKINYTYIDMKHDGISYPIAKMKVKYIRPATFNDNLIIETSILSIEPTMNLRYKIFNKKTNEKIFEAETMQIAVDINSYKSKYTAPEKLLKALNGRKNEEI